jgi:predicted RND superfamily exporter protein
MGDPNEDRITRMRLASKSMGKSVLMGGLTSLLGLIPLAFSRCEVFRVFFQVG